MNKPWNLCAVYCGYKAAQSICTHLCSTFQRHVKSTQKPMPACRRSYGVKNYRTPFKIGLTQLNASRYTPMASSEQFCHERRFRKRKKKATNLWLPFNLYFVFRNKFWIRDNVTIVLLFPLPSHRWRPVLYSWLPTRGVQLTQLRNEWVGIVSLESKSIQFFFI